MKKKDFCVFLDAGHGGVNPDGLYTTSPSKQFRHGFSGFHKDGWFLEGVSNRNITYKVSEMLNRLHIPNVIVSHPYQDTSLTHRAHLANTLSQSYLQSIYISNHSNACGNCSARGFEIYTSPGETKSDLLAAMYWNKFENEFKSYIDMRPYSKGEVDKEAKFSVLVRTAMPAILTEHLFFDNIADALLLMSDNFQNRLASVQTQAVLEYFNSLNA